MAVGILNLMKLPVIPGMEEFEGKAFHTARWDYEYTGGSAGRPAPHQAGRQGGRRRRRAARARIQAVAAARGVGEARVRVPAHAVGDRRARQPPDRRGVRRAAPPRLAAGADGELQRGDDRARRSSAISSTTGGRSTWRKVTNPAIEPGMAPEDIARWVEEFDYEVMEEHRTRIDEIVADPAVAESLKPYYRYLCKRPLLPRRVPRRVQQPERDAGRLPGRRRADHRAQRRRQRQGVRARLHRLRDRLRGRAHAVRPARRPHRSSGAAASRWRRSGRTA